eukprot:TRINITY_DN1388_c0_g3_i1.p1 TRINITY_DN1388_c0_g3~~TRINITY_DN1388_c0_g3_i1.p1  ORF type:complete len:275 (+),score=39.69 TRINITY_DN1388_c0_g3_i1:243-1067(+)
MGQLNFPVTQNHILTPKLCYMLSIVLQNQRRRKQRRGNNMASNVWNVTVVLIILVVISFVCYRYFDITDSHLQPRDFSQEELVVKQEAVEANEAQAVQEQKPAVFELQSAKDNNTFLTLVCDFRQVSAALPTGELIMNKEACTMEDFKSALQKFEAEHAGPHYVLFTASLDPNTNEPWCPDCRRSLSVIRQVVAAAGGSLLEIMVGERGVWKSPDHPFRHDQLLKLTGIPTLTRWQGGQPVARVGSELERSKDQTEAKEIAEKFVESTKQVNEQ